MQENYNLVTLSIESNYGSILEAAEKRIDYIGFLEKEFLTYFSQVVANITEEHESRQLLSLITRFDYLFQVQDSIEDLFNAKRAMNKRYIEIRSDVLLMVRELSSETLGLFDDIHKGLLEQGRLDVAEKGRALHLLTENINRELLVLLAHPDRKDAGAMSNFVTFSRRLADKLLNFAHLCEQGPRAKENLENDPI